MLVVIIMIEKLKEKYVFLILMGHYLNIDIKIDYMVEDVLNSDANHLKIYCLMICFIRLGHLKQCKEL